MDNFFAIVSQMTERSELRLQMVNALIKKMGAMNHAESLIDCGDLGSVYIVYAVDHFTGEYQWQWQWFDGPTRYSEDYHVFYHQTQKKICIKD